MAIVLDFAGNSQWVGRTSDLLNHNADYTFMAWVYNTAPSSGTPLWFSGDPASPASADYLLSDDGSGNLWLIVFTDDVTIDFQTGGAFSANTWTHIALTRSGNTLTLYQDGVSTAVSTLDITGRAATAIQYHPNDGRSAYIKTWSKALSAAQVASEMNTIRPLEADSLYAWLPTFTGDTERTRDYSGNGRDWIEQNPPLADGDAPPVSWGASPILVQNPPANTR